MADQRGLRDDSVLADALRGIGAALAVPSGGEAGLPDIAARVRARIVVDGTMRAAPRRGPRWSGIARPFAGLGRVRRGLVLAVVLLIAIAATAGAVGLGLPGIRIILGPVPTTGPSSAPTETPGTSTSPGARAAPGASLGLGILVLPADLDRLTAPDVLGFTVRLPADPEVGAPGATYIDGARVAMAWPSGPSLPATETPSVGLVLSQFRGSIDPGSFGKIVGAGTTVERVDVDGASGFWITGELHFFFYEDPDGRIVEESRRFVGDTLVWTVDDVTYRLETATGLERALAIAMSLRSP
ncbi:MAG: hypothetical protein AABZ33_08580 [Chloroflexota bacterium]